MPKTATKRKRILTARQMALKRWKRTTKAQRKAVSKRMHAARWGKRKVA